ncbi:uncharacterized protein ARMOST_10630 [Armillaria ostoyae]|uniref:Uncharacterized protein n=1 Tax=Armillaria ostoyae TaxID=47428 RepID=A0A284REW7_ARMOS|nr:uncharacterized protein ARMOST_10630 [Armillaria ostoyae]
MHRVCRTSSQYWKRRPHNQLPHASSLNHREIHGGSIGLCVSFLAARYYLPFVRNKFTNRLHTPHAAQLIDSWSIQKNQDALQL